MTHSRYKSGALVAEESSTHWGPNPPTPLGRFAPNTYRPALGTATVFFFYRDHCYDGHQTNYEC